MDGTKRFTAAKVVGGKRIRPNEVLGQREPEVSRNSTAALGYQLLNPVVSEEEQAEYQGWVLKPHMGRESKQPLGILTNTRVHWIGQALQWRRGIGMFIKHLY